jgi:hypothetical protein
MLIKAVGRNRFATSVVKVETSIFANNQPRVTIYRRSRLKGNPAMKQMQRTAAARAATKRIRMAMPPEDRKALGLRLFAIYSGQQTQKHYRMRGIYDPCAKAREAKSRKAKLRRETESRAARAGEN